MNRAAWVPLVNLRQIEFVSKRVGNPQYGQNGMLAERVWLRSGESHSASRLLAATEEQRLSRN